jgi:hypothetical protein
MDRAFAVVGAVVFAQAPLFMQQYSQQLIGRTAELKLQVDGMRQAADLSGKTLAQLVQKFMQNPDPDVFRQGELMAGTIARWHSLSESLTAMQESSLWSRPFAFIYHLNFDVFYDTLHQFKVGLPLNMEGGAYALIGVLTGYLVFSLFKKIALKISGLFSKRFRSSSPSITRN